MGFPSFQLYGSEFHPCDAQLFREIFCFAGLPCAGLGVRHSDFGLGPVKKALLQGIPLRGDARVCLATNAFCVPNKTIFLVINLLV